MRHLKRSVLLVVTLLLCSVSQAVSIKVGQSTTLTGPTPGSTRGADYSWSVPSYHVSTSSPTQKTITVTGESPGTVTLTCTVRWQTYDSTTRNYVYANANIKTQSYSVTVTESSSGSGSGSGSGGSSSTSPTSISLSYSSVSLQVGGTRQLYATVSPSGASQSVTWSVYSGSSYVSVSSSGLVTAKAAGTATVRATSTVDNTVYKNCTVTVTEPVYPITAGTWSGNTLTIDANATSSDYSVPYNNYYQYSTTQMLYTPTEIGKSGVINSIAFKVANSSSLSTSELNVYLGHKSGLFSSSSDYMTSGNLTLVYSGSPTLGQTTGWETLTFNEGTFSYNGTDNLVVVVTRKCNSWNSSLKYYYYNTGSGYTLLRGNDSSTTYGSLINTSGYSTSSHRPAVRMVFAPTPTSISLNHTSMSLQVGGTGQLSATVSPSGASQSVKWTVPSGSSYVSVSSSGLVTAKAAGTATVRATSTVNSSVYKNCTVTVSNPIEIAINATNFPDENFRNFLLQQSYGQDGVLTEEEIQGVTSINVDSKNISSLKGIEFFTALTELFCSYNQLTALDVSKNTALTILACITNQLTALDVSKNTTLTHLSCPDNQLTTLDVSNNSVLTLLYCTDNQLTSLDVSNNPALTYLACPNNQLTALDVSKNRALESINCWANQLTALDVSNNTALTTLNCSSNKISGASMDNLINSLPVREATNQEEIYVINLSDASEGNVCTKSQVAALKAKGWIPMSYDGSNTAEYEGSEGITISINATNFPDENFRNFLLQQSYGQDGVLTEEEIQGVTSISVYSENISSLKGIEHFTALTWLWCENSQLTALDVSKNTALETLNCNENHLTALDVSKNTALKTLYCSNNQLTALDVSNNPALTTLYCKNNQLTALDVSKNTALKYLYCVNNHLTALDVSKNTALKTLYCSNNQLTALDVSKNTALTTLNCSYNQLTALDVSKSTALTELFCYNNRLTALDVSKNTALTELYCICNKIIGASMDGLINSLPNYETENTGEILIINASDPNEGNVCTKTQVAAIKAKGWKPYNGNEKNYSEYEGSEGEVDPLVFAAVNTNGVTMTFKITDEQAKTCQIGTGTNAAIDIATSGRVVLPITVNGYTVTAIGANAFAGTNIYSVIIPNNIASIGGGAFQNCEALESVQSYIEEPFDIPSNAFSGISNSVELEIIYGTKNAYLAAAGWDKFSEYDENTYFINGIRYSVDGATPNGKKNPYTAWVNRSYWNHYAGDVVIPETFAIGNETFTVEGIDDGAFYGSAIRSVIIPKTVRSIDDHAFADCQQLQTVKSYIMEPKDESDAFLNIPSSATLYVPAGTKALYESQGGWNLFTNIVEMEEVVEPTDISQIDNVIYLEKTEAAAGSVLNLSIKMKNTADIRGFQFDLYLPEGVSAVKSARGKIQGGLTADRLPEEDEHQLTFSEQSDGAIRFLCGSQYDETFTGSDGEIATLQVSIAEDIQDGDYPIVLKNVLLNETDISKFYESALVKSTLTITSYILGDINGDGIVNVLDYTGIANRIHGNTPEGFIEKAADVNADGIINVLDYTGVANIIHTGSVTGTSNARIFMNTDMKEPQ